MRKVLVVIQLLSWFSFERSIRFIHVAVLIVDSLGMNTGWPIKTRRLSKLSILEGNRQARHLMF